MKPEQVHKSVQLYSGDCFDVLAQLEPNSIDSVVTDPPYALVSIVKRFGKDGSAPAKSNGPTGVYARASRGFMGQLWDTGEVAFNPELWARVLGVLKPGAYLVAFGGTRTYHRLACAIEDAGFEIRDCIQWLYGSGFPKSLNVSKQLDKRAGVKGTVIRSERNWGSRPEIGPDGHVGHWEVTEPATDDAREWDGFGTALKPSHEMLVLARKPLSENTIVANLLKWGTGSLNIDKCRVEHNEDLSVERSGGNQLDQGGSWGFRAARDNKGRWPANVVHDGSDEVVAAFPKGDFGSTARYFYTAKADADDRLNSSHPTIKPVDLMQWLVRLVTPPPRLICKKCENKNDSAAKIDSSTFMRPVRKDIQTKGQPTSQSVLQQTMCEQMDDVETQGVRVLSKNVSTEGVGATVLREALRKSVGRKAEAQLDTKQMGLSASVDARASSVTRSKRVHLRTPLVDAAENRTLIDERRGGSSQERHQVGQSFGEPGIDVEAGPRQIESSTSKHVGMSALQGKDCNESTCPHCGNKLERVGGVVLDLFAGTGTTGEAAFREGMRAILIEREEEYQADIRKRMSLVLASADRRRVVAGKKPPQTKGVLF